MSDRDPPQRPLSSSRGLPRIVIGLLTATALVGLLILWNNHRGRSKWEKYKLELEARGDTLDWLAYLPPPLPPDEENFAATPLLKAVGVKGKGNPGVLGQFKAPVPDSLLGRTGDWIKGRRAELGALQRFFRTNADFSLPSLPQEPAADLLAVLETVRPQLDELRAASTRLQAQLPLNYPDPISADVPDFVSFRRLALLLSLRASAELALGQSDEACADLRVIHRLGDALKAEPTLVSAMIGVAVYGLELQAFWEGWWDGRWTDPQLEEFQARFAAVDLLAMVDRGMRGERAGVTRFIEKSTSRKIAQTFGSPFWRGPSAASWKDRLADFGIRFSPLGLRYENLLNFCSLWDQFAFDNYSVERSRIFVSRLATHSKITSKSFEAPFHYLSAIAVPNTYRAIQNVARNQTALNQAMLVCALERYRRARGYYPETLDALLPDFISKLPHDLITGQSLNYRRSDGGKFLLYSVGWDEKDDGGLPDQGKGDWVWPTSVTE